LPPPSAASAVSSVHAPPPCPAPFPYTTLFRSDKVIGHAPLRVRDRYLDAAGGLFQIDFGQVGGEGGQGGGAQQLLKAETVALDQKAGIRHLFGAHKIPEPDVVHQDHGFPVYLGERKAFAPGKPVPRGQGKSRGSAAAPAPTM